MAIFDEIKEKEVKELRLNENELVAKTNSYAIYRSRETGALYIQTTEYQSGILIFPKECLEYLALSEINK